MSNTTEAVRVGATVIAAHQRDNRMAAAAAFEEARTCLRAFGADSETITFPEFTGNHEWRLYAESEYIGRVFASVYDGLPTLRTTADDLRAGDLLNLDDCGVYVEVALAEHFDGQTEVTLIDPYDPAPLPNYYHPEGAVHVVRL